MKDHRLLWLDAGKHFPGERQVEIKKACLAKKLHFSSSAPRGSPPRLLPPGCGSVSGARTPAKDPTLRLPFPGSPLSAWLVRVPPVRASLGESSPAPAVLGRPTVPLGSSWPLGHRASLLGLFRGPELYQQGAKRLSLCRRSPSSTQCLPSRPVDSSLGLSFLNPKLGAMHTPCSTKTDAKQLANFIKGFFSARDLPLIASFNP